MHWFMLTVRISAQFMPAMHVQAIATPCGGACTSTVALVTPVAATGGLLYLDQVNSDTSTVSEAVAASSSSIIRPRRRPLAPCETPRPAVHARAQTR